MLEIRESQDFAKHQASENEKLLAQQGNCPAPGQMTHWDILASPNSVGANVFWRSVHITQVNVMCYQFSNFCFFRI